MFNFLVLTTSFGNMNVLGRNTLMTVLCFGTHLVTVFMLRHGCKVGLWFLI